MYQVVDSRTWCEIHSLLANACAQELDGSACKVWFSGTIVDLPSLLIHVLSKMACVRSPGARFHISILLCGAELDLSGKLWKN